MGDIVKVVKPYYTCACIATINSVKYDSIRNIGTKEGLEALAELDEGYGLDEGTPTWAAGCSYTIEVPSQHG